MELKKYKLEELCKLSSAKRIFENEYVNDGVPFIRGQEVSDKSILDENAKFDCYISQERYNEIKRDYGVPQKGDILMTAVGTIGNLVVLNTDRQFYFKDGNIIRFSDFAETVCPEWLAFYMQSSFFKKQLKYQLIGAVQKALTMVMLNKTEILLPPLEYQRKIAAALSSIDDKIALNRAINQNLEALAKQLYDYWFVQFDFPYKEGKPYKSSGGKMVWNEKLKREIPEGWSVNVIDDVAEVYNGATPSTADEENYGGDVVWITPKDLSNQQQKFIYQGERNISHKGYESCSTHLLPSNTVLMSSRAPIGLLAIAKIELCTNQGFKSFVPKNDNMASYLYYYIQTHIKQIEQLGTGTTFKEVSREDVLKFPILQPDYELLNIWEERISAINEKQLEIQKENENLTKQRDELLPLLMNGQVTIE